jgi:NADPH:quinone reductase
MHAITVRRHGGPEVLEYAQVPDPVAGPGELLVAVAAAGVNYIDTYYRAGKYPRPLPFGLGSEGSGTVTAVGEGVADFVVGDQVAWADGTIGIHGGYADLVAIQAERAVQVPAGLDLETAASALLQGMTAHYLTNSTWPIQPGDTALVHAAAGGMGLLLDQMITAKGGRVIGTVSTAAKESAARAAGADEVIRYTEVEDLAAEVRRLTDGKGVDVVYDGVGADTFEASLASLRPRGLLALYGAASGQVPPFDPQRLNGAGSLFLTRPSLGCHVTTREDLLRRAGEVLAMVADGSLKITVGGRYPLAEAAVAHRDLEGRATSGKLLLIP